MAKKKSDWQNRIVGHDTKPASWFLANEANWRIHPKNQQDSLGGVLDEVGWVQDVIVNKRTSEEWGADQNIETLVDGHLRITLALRNGDETPVPVKYVDLSPDEERLVLLTLDPLGAMAASDKAKLDELMRAVQSDDDRVQAMIAEIAEKQGIIPVDENDWTDAFGKLPDEDRAPFQQMTFTLHDVQVEVVKDAIRKAGKEGDFDDSENQNGNGNALAWICEAYLNG